MYHVDVLFGVGVLLLNKRKYLGRYVKDILEDSEACTIFTMENFIIHDFIILHYVLDEKYIIFLGRIISFSASSLIILLSCFN